MSLALVVSCHIASEPPHAQFLNLSFFPVSNRPLENRNILLQLSNVKHVFPKPLIDSWTLLMVSLSNNQKS